MPRQHTRSLAIGLVAAAAAPVALFTGYVLLLAVWQPASGYNLLIPAMTLVVGLMISVPTCAVLGIPVVLLLRKLGWLTVPTVCLSAALCGALGFGVASYRMNYFSAAGARAHEMAMAPVRGALAAGSVLGLVAGAALCLASGIRWRRCKARVADAA